MVTDGARRRRGLVTTDKNPAPILRERGCSFLKTSARSQHSVINALFDVLSHIPGDPGYNPWWKVIVVIPLDGRDVSVDPFTSEAEILAAADDGSVLLLDINFVFLCQVLPGR